MMLHRPGEPEQGRENQESVHGLEQADLVVCCRGGGGD